MRHSGLGALRMTDHAITPAKPSTGSVPKNGLAQLRRACMRPFNLRLPLLGPSAPLTIQFEFEFEIRELGGAQAAA